MGRKRRTEYLQFRENIWLQAWPHPNLNLKLPFDISESPGCCIVSPLVELEVGGLGYSPSTQCTDNRERQVGKLTRKKCRF